MAKTALFQARMCANLNCISIMMSFLTYITGFFMNFELCWTARQIFGREPSNDYFIKILFLLRKWFQTRTSETTGTIATKLRWNDPWMAPFQICVRWSRLPTKMATKLKIEKGGMKFKKNLLLLSKWFQTKRFLWEFPIGFYVKLSSVVAAILVGGLKWRTQIWKGTTQGSFQQSLVEIGSKDMSGCSALRPRWPPQPNLA
jgi:hypothetical protein